MKKGHIEKDRRIDQSVLADDNRGCGRINSKGFKANKRTTAESS